MKLNRQLLLGLIVVGLPLLSCARLFQSNTGIPTPVSGNQAPTGQVTIQINWPGMSPSAFRTKSFPTRTYSIYIAVTASDITTSINTFVIYPATTASLSVPVGTNRKFWAIAKDAMGLTLSTGSSELTSITTGGSNSVSIAMTNASESSGQTSTFAGDGTNGSLDGIGSVAKIGTCNSIVSDSQGNLYFSENDKIRKITPQGAVSTIASGYNLVSNPFVDALDNVYFCDYKDYKSWANGYAKFYKYSNNSVTLILSDTGYSNTNIFSLNSSKGCVKDTLGNFYLSTDTKIYKYTKSGSTYTQSIFSGSNTAGYLDGASALFTNITDMTMDPSGNIYVADMGSNAIRKVSSTGFVTTVISNAPSASGVWLDSNMNVYVSCATKVLKLSNNGGQLTVIAGQATAGYVNDTGVNAKFNGVLGVCSTPDGSVFVTDSNNHRIRRIAP